MQNVRMPILQSHEAIVKYQALLIAIFSAGMPRPSSMPKPQRQAIDSYCSAASCASLRCVAPNATDSETHSETRSETHHETL